MKWKKVKLEDVIKVKSGINLTQEKMCLEGSYPVYGGNGTTGRHSAYNVSESTIVIGRVGYYCGSIHLTSGKAWVTDNAFITSFSPSIFNKKYLFYALRNMNLRKYSNSSAQPVISGTGISQAEIPLPPLHIQQHIADTLDKADALRRKDQELLQKYDELAQAIFYDMFGDPVRNEKRWPIRSIDNILSEIEAGTSVGGEERTLTSVEKAVLKISSVTSGKFLPGEFKVPDQKLLPVNMVLPSKGDLLFSRANTRELVGATAVVEKDYSNLFLPDKLWKLKLIDGVSPYYMKFLLTDKSIRYELTKTATGTSGSMLNISMQKLKGLLVPIPPEIEQRKFERSLMILYKQVDILSSVSHRSNEIFETILKSNFQA